MYNLIKDIREKGFTLAEVLVSVSLIAFIVIGIYEVFIVGNRGWHTGAGIVDLQQGSRRAMDGMTREIRQSRPSEAEIQNGGISFSVYDQEADEWIGQIDYFLDAGDENQDNKANQILREYPPGEYRILAEDIDFLDFCWLQADASCGDEIKSGVVEISLKARKTVYSGELCFPMPCDDDTRVLKEKVRLRNQDE